MVSTHEFGQMKDGVVLVNTARGAIVDEEALVRALESGKVASAGLDVYENEPNVHPDLAANPHVLLLPHMGTWTVEVSHAISFSPLHVSNVVNSHNWLIVVQGAQCLVSNPVRLQRSWFTCLRREVWEHKGSVAKCGIRPVKLVSSLHFHSRRLFPVNYDKKELERDVPY
jgi:hypothetical protein